MAGGSPLTGSSKELTAVIVNLKEARILDKAVQTLSLEESYAAKLLDLNSKMVKFNYRRLKNNVSKIRTNLRSEDIIAMKSLELDGKFKAEHPRICSSSSATKIAAAHKRLNLNTYRRAQSATPRIQHRYPTARTDSDTDSIRREHTDEPNIACSRRRLRPKTSVMLEQLPETVESRSPRPKSTTLVLEKITRAQKANKIQASQVSYSCHDEKAPETEETKGNKSVLDVFGPNPYEERRQKLLYVEGRTFTGLREKKKGFVSEMERFVAENPWKAVEKPEKTQEIIQSIDSMAARPGRLRSRLTSNSSRERLRDRSLLREFAEIRKTRYLRIDESLIEYSANTLASEFSERTLPWRQYKNDALSFHDSVLL